MSALPSSGVLDGGVHRLQLRVYFEDTDTAAIVYHAKYLHFLERGRTEFLRVAGIDHAAAVREGLGAYAVTQMDCRWLRPARLDDVLLVETRLISVRAAACRIDQAIIRDGTPIFTANLTAAFLDPAGRPRRQPRDWLALYHSLIPQDA
ncbi:YbgC/FadM family acyl-CoA thioesterase [Sandarakinorhabdus sp.]|uniref:YbgC/FadM family acyl-CoA thioesterase n=1 Tax=Sandarakinorhabdus sp. TaxID=1916663 RepID=UPI00333E3F00